MTQPIAERLAANSHRLCSELGCRLPVHRIGSRCAKHDQRMQLNGHATAAVIGHVELRPWIRHCRAFVDRQAAADHPGISAACKWLDMQAAAAPDPGKLYRKAPPIKRWYSWLARLKREAIDPRQVIAAGIAVYLHRAAIPERYPSDRQFAQTLGKHVVHVVGRVRLRTIRDDVKYHDLTRPERTPAGFLLFTAGNYRRPSACCLSVRRST